MKFALPMLAAVLSLQAYVANAAEPTYTGKGAWEYIRRSLDSKQFDVITATSPGVFTGFASDGRNGPGSLYMICTWGLSRSATQPFYACYRIDTWEGTMWRSRR
ncbi:MAG: hypothetical protein VW440_08490 [Bordetella sp.]